MIDWHSHILPGIDDGSRSVSESLEMLDMLAKQGITTVIATPHFYANRESVEAFLGRRDDSVQLLKAQRPEGVPRILCGAEVRYYPGISAMEDLKRLRIQESDLLLLEMPMEKWTEYTIRELIALASRGKTTVVLAHIERYLSLQSAETWDRLLESGVLMQANACFFTGFWTKKKALTWLKDKRIRFVGSDCHNTAARPPQIGSAFAVIEKMLGKEFLHRLDQFWNSLLA